MVARGGRVGCRWPVVVEVAGVMLLWRVCAAAFCALPLFFSASGLPWWRGEAGEGGEARSQPLFFVKCGFPCIVFLKVSLPHLAGLGGEEVGKSGLSVGWSRASPHLELLEIRLSAEIPPHQRLAAGAIRGHRDGWPRRTRRFDLRELFPL
jgi:hypothetical protein